MKLQSVKMDKRELKMARFTRYSVWQTFGLPVEVKPAELPIILEKIERDFDLIMITEFMAESLILLKEDLNLEMEDIAGFARNLGRALVK